MSQPWSTAMHDALYGESAGFYRRQRGADHFRTSATAAAPVLARAIRALADRVDAGLGHPDRFDVVDLGAGDGALLHALAEQPDLPRRWRLTAVEIDLAAQPTHPRTKWAARLPDVDGLLLANEMLDVVPVEVLFDGRVVEVDDDGTEHLGGPADAEALSWAERWWPAGRRVEVGRRRDATWAHAVGRVSRGVAVAMDYGHVLGAAGAGQVLAGSSASRRPLTGVERMAWGDRRPTLTGYRDGRQVRPIPDGSCDLTAHVAVDACLAAVGSGHLLMQREALLALGIDATPPARALATADPHTYLAGLADSAGAAALLDPRSLGGFAWLVCPVGVPHPLAPGAA